MTCLRVDSCDWGRLGGFSFGRGGMEINGINGGELEGDVVLQMLMLIFVRFATLFL